VNTNRVLLAFCLCLSCVLAHAQCPGGEDHCDTSVPRLVKYSGALKDNLGRPYTGVVGVLFSVYASSSGGSSVWQELQNVNLDKEGHYNVLLGTGTTGGVPVNLFSSTEPRWLGVQPAMPGEVERPRVVLVSVPYALKAADAETLGGLPPSAFLRAPASLSQSPYSTSSTTVVAAAGGAPLPHDTPVTTPAGTPDTIAKFSAGSSVVDSQLTDSNGVASLQNLANILFADRFSNGVPDAIAACPANGCTIYAGNTTVNRNLGTIDPVGKAITIYLGPYTYNVKQIVMRKSLKLIGMGASAGLSGTVTCTAIPCNGTTLQSTNGNSPVIVLPQHNNQPATNAVLSGFRLLGSPNNTSEEGILFDTSTLTNAGLWYSTLSDIYLDGFAGDSIHLKGPGGNFGAINQWLHFDNVIVFRPPGAGNGLRIEGANFELEFTNCEFDGQTAGDGTNIYIGGVTSGTNGYPLNIRFTGLVTQAAAVGVQIDGAIGLSFYSSHHEKLWGVYSITNNTNIGTKGVTIAETNFFGVGINNGAGYLLNVGTSIASGIIFAHNQILGNPDAVVIGTNIASIVYRDNLYYEHTSFNLPPSTGVTTQITPAATINIGGAHTVGLNPSATPITTIQGGHGAGELVTFFMLSGSAVFASGGNINLMGPNTITVTGSITFVRNDLTGQSLAWVPLSQWTPNSASAGVGFNLSASPSSANVRAGTGLTLDLSVTPTGGFNGSVAFHCTGTPPESSCTISPNPLTVQGTDPLPATVAIATAAASSRSKDAVTSNLRVFHSTSFGMLAVGMLFSCVPVPTGKSKRNRRWPEAMAVLLLLLLSFGCGGSSFTAPSDPGTPTGIYKVNIIGTSGSTSRSTSVTLTVT
jgi:hypothetical protein